MSTINFFSSPFPSIFPNVFAIFLLLLPLLLLILLLHSWTSISLPAPPPLLSPHLPQQKLGVPWNLSGGRKEGRKSIHSHQETGQRGWCSQPKISQQHKQHSTTSCMRTVSVAECWAVRSKGWVVAPIVLREQFVMLLNGRFMFHVPWRQRHRASVSWSQRTQSYCAMVTEGREPMCLG